MVVSCGKVWKVFVDMSCPSSFDHTYWEVGFQFAIGWCIIIYVVIPLLSCIPWIQEVFGKTKLFTAPRPEELQLQEDFLCRLSCKRHEWWNLHREWVFHARHPFLGTSFSCNVQAATVTLSTKEACFRSFNNLRRKCSSPERRYKDLPSIFPRQWLDLVLRYKDLCADAAPFRALDQACSWLWRSSTHQNTG